ncbi:hypothetical protein ES676_02050 [Bizionia saleffrena]|uniref:Carboxypeptidase-like regulatory domain-containing protein n=1 Tax=Bizionia saleffrena TaxID=291189 RepID=A0A8H2LG46_9FLAO|nr:hypothetical protein ES676_02050 [Bizionia saleffrena]
MLVFHSYTIYAQGQKLVIDGEVFSEDSDAIEGLHVINTTQNQNTTTDANGKFTIEVAVNDQLEISSIQYKKVTLVITETHLKNKRIVLYLEIEVNALAEVKLGNTLSGNLYDDIANSKAKKPIDFYDVGIPGYKGKRKTKSERLLQEAGDFKPGMLIGILVLSVPINPILNGLSGRTKRLKQRVALEANTEAMQKLIAKLGAAFFNDYPLETSRRMDFFYFCAEDENFNNHIGGGNIEMFDFVIEKYKEYQKNLNLKE